MEKLKVFIDWDENFGAVSEQVDGCVSTAKTFEEVKEAYLSALEFHLQGMANEEIPTILQGNYKVVFELTPTALLAAKMDTGQ